MTKPYLKWVGGKRQLSDIITNKLREKLTPDSTYFEPFLGGGAILLDLEPSSWIAGDANPFLVKTWNTVRDEKDVLLGHLNALAETYNNLPSIENKTTYYMERRAEFNNHTSDSEYESALFVFLNHTCFNGLWRVNKSNGFNVPHNKTLKYPAINVDVYDSVTRFLQTGGVVRNVSFVETLATCQPGDVVYLDPPYIPLNQTSFTSYTKDGFTMAHQRELASTVKELSDKGVWVLLSNSNSPLVKELYPNFIIQELSGTRSVNRNAKERGLTKCETIVSNW